MRTRASEEFRLARRVCLRIPISFSVDESMMPFEEPLAEGFLRGEVENLGLGGLRFRLGTFIPQGVFLKLQLKVKDHDDINDYVNLQAKVVYSQIDTREWRTDAQDRYQAGRSYSIGVAFLGLTAWDKNRIRDLIARAQARNNAMD